MNHLQRASFALGWKRPIDVGLPQSFSKITIGVVYTSPPARLILLLTGKRVREELEVLIDQRFVQEWGRAMNQIPAQICLPVFERVFANELLFGAEEIGRSHDV